MSQEDLQALEGRMKRAVLWGLSDDGCLERFGKPRADIVSALKIKGAQLKEKTT